jgi:hypothetical protein
LRERRGRGGRVEREEERQQLGFDRTILFHYKKRRRGVGKKQEESGKKGGVPAAQKDILDAIKSVNRGASTPIPSEKKRAKEKERQKK